MKNTMNSKCLEVVQVGRVVAFVNGVKSQSGSWLTYGVVIRPGHPLYAITIDKEGREWKPDNLRYSSTHYTNWLDGLRVHYRGKWFTGDTFGPDMTVQDALVDAIALAEELDVM